MRRATINSVAFVVGVLLVSIPALVFAGTYPATATGYVGTTVYNTLAVGSLEQCKSEMLGAWTNKYPGYNCSGGVWVTESDGNVGFHLSQCGGAGGLVCTPRGWECANGGTLSGRTCTKECTEGTLQPDGQCKTICPIFDELIWVAKAKSGSEDVTGTYCSGGCSVSYSLDLSQPNYYESSSTIWLPLSKRGDGSSCTTPSQSLPGGSPTPPNQPIDDVPCNPGQGVISSSGGKVQCVDPSAVPQADAPTVKKETSTKTYDDGSQTITTTIQTCTGTGACSTITTVTNMPSTGGGAGKAGEPGTTTEAKDTGPNVKNGESQGEFCAMNPNLQICKGGMATEDTLKKVATEETLKKLTDAPEVDDSVITDRSNFASGELIKEGGSYQIQIESQMHSVTDDPRGRVPQEVSNKTAWQSAMESGWFSPIPTSGCAAGTISVAGHVMTLDWCDRFAQVSEILSYAMWIGLLFGVFAMMTGGRGN